MWPHVTYTGFEMCPQGAIWRFVPLLVIKMLRIDGSSTSEEALSLTIDQIPTGKVSSLLLWKQGV